MQFAPPQGHLENHVHHLPNFPFSSPVWENTSATISVFSHGAASGLDVTMEGSHSLSHSVTQSLSHSVTQSVSHGTLHLRAQ